MTNLTVSQARDTLSNLLGKVQHGREDVIIQKHGTPMAVMIPVEAMACFKAPEDTEPTKLAAAV